MFEVIEEAQGFRVFCNGHSITSGIPKEDLAIAVVQELQKEERGIDWINFDGALWMPEHFAVSEALEKVKSEYEAEAVSLNYS
jgi:hypothetical protein